jgi:hypothetical protein
MSIDDLKVPIKDGQIQFVIGAGGKPTGVLLDIATWERIIQALEDVEDLNIAKQALADLDAAGGDLQKAGYISWEQARAELEADES